MFMLPKYNTIVIHAIAIVIIIMVIIHSSHVNKYISNDTNATTSCLLLSVKNISNGSSKS